jgi:acyl-CoA dehydrogenase
MAWDFETDAEFEERLEWMRGFVRRELFPLELVDADWREIRQLARPLQQEVKDAGLWAAHLDPELGGQGFGQVKLALMHEVLGECDYAPLVFGCQAPDSGNSELLAIAATEEQRRRWMEPLLDGSLMSAYSMTELGTGSDPRQFTTRAERRDGAWILNGRKWFVGNGSRSDFHIVMVITDPDAEPHRRASMLIVPSDSEGISFRELGYMHHPDLPGNLWSHDEVVYDGVRVPEENLLGGEGEAFVLGQKRLGPGRLHHAMRWIGVSNRALRMLCERAASVSVHGSLLGEKGMIQTWIADCTAEMRGARLLTLEAAWKLEKYGSRAARTEIAMIKYFGAKVMHEVLDKAIQVHGSLGYSTDMPLESMYRWSRAARIYDGPDEVHRMLVARQALKGIEPTAVPTEHVPIRRQAAQEKFEQRLVEIREGVASA